MLNIIMAIGLAAGIISAGFAGDGLAQADFARDQDRRAKGQARFNLAAPFAVIGLIVFIVGIVAQFRT